MSSYEDAFRQSVDDPEAFWLAAAQSVEWDTTPTRALDDTQAPSYKWFPDGTLNTSVNALDRHVRAGHGDRPALIWDSAMVPAKRTYTYSELLDEVATFAGVLRDQGVVAGDRVIIYMPMIPEAAIAMLACARIGAVHSVVFGGFAAKELATRIDDAQPVLLVTASGGSSRSHHRVPADGRAGPPAVADSTAHRDREEPRGGSRIRHRLQGILGRVVRLG